MKMVAAICPDCGEEINLKGKIELGRQVTCPYCEAELEIVETVPVELDWRSESDDYEDEDL
jgi:lysine biosynthesis protein LysW